jgi:uncharacterized protein
MIQPTPARLRIFSIDALRGFAVLGILLMNILAFALPDSSRLFPDSIPNNTGLNFAAWVATYLAVSGVFRAMFGMMFGASVLLFTSRGDERMPPGEVADLYYRRTLWLMAFGLVHGYLLLGWIDVLFEYGVIGLVLFPFRRLAPRWLALIAGIAMAVPLSLAGYRTLGHYEDRAAAARVEAQGAVGDTASVADQLRAARWARRVSENTVTAAALQAELATRRSGYWANFRDNTHRYASRQSSIILGTFWDGAMMMFLGMALLKWRVLTAERSRRFYLWMALLGFGAGLAIKAQQLRLMFVDHFDPFSMAAVESSYDPSRALVAVGYIGAIMLICRSGRLQFLTRRLSAVGRMALSNYLLQTVICVLLFYGVGVGLFGRLERWQLLYAIAGIWCFQLVASPVWLRHFRFGPLEWLWRSLTYLDRQPMRITAHPLK